MQPSVGFYNLFNFANFDLPGNALNGLLTGAAGQINGTTSTGHNNSPSTASRIQLYGCLKKRGRSTAEAVSKKIVPF
jgi:hypothetical protein